MIEHAIDTPQMTTTTEPGASGTPAAPDFYPTMPPAENDQVQEGQQLDSEKAESGAQAEYVDLKIPGGLNLDDGALGDFKSFAKEQHLSAEQAKKVLEYGGAHLKSIIEAPYKAWSDLQDHWQREVKAQYGAKLDESIETARLVFQVSETNPFIKSGAEAAALKRALIHTGAGNHPAVVRMFFKMGQYIAARQTPQQKLLTGMYPNME